MRWYEPGEGVEYMMSNSIYDELKDISKGVWERVTSPLISSLLISFCILNWEIIILLFWGNASAQDTVFNIKSHFLNMDDSKFIFRTILMPVLASAFYIFVYPFPARFVYQFAKKRQEELIALKNEIENKRLLTVEQSINIRLEIEKAKLEVEQIVDKKNDEISYLRKQIEDLKQQPVQNIPNTVETLSRKNWDNEFDTFKEKPQCANFKMKINDFTVGLFHTKVNSSIADFINLDLVEKRESYYYLSEKGKYFANKLKGFVK